MLLTPHWIINVADQAGALLLISSIKIYYRGKLNLLMELPKRETVNGTDIME